MDRHTTYVIFRYYILLILKTNVHTPFTFINKTPQTSQFLAVLQPLNFLNKILSHCMRRGTQLFFFQKLSKVGQKSLDISIVFWNTKISLYVSFSFTHSHTHTHTHTHKHHIALPSFESNTFQKVSMTQANYPVTRPVTPFLALKVQSSLSVIVKIFFGSKMKNFKMNRVMNGIFLTENLG